MSMSALLFLLVFFGGLAATIFYSGSSAFILYQLVYFLNPDNRWWSAHIPGISYSLVSALLMLGMCGLSYKKYTEISPWNQQPVFKWLVALVIVYFLAYSWALNPNAHDQFTIYYVKMIIIIMVAYKLLNTEKVLDASIWAYIIGATYIGYLATITGRNSGDRVEGIGMADSPDANGVAAALVPAGALLMYYAWMGTWKVRLLCVACGALIANGLVLINSRGSFLGVVAGSGLYLFFMMFSKYRKKGQRAMAIMIAVGGLSGAIYVTDAQFWERMQTLQDLESEESGAGRVTFWLTTFDMLEDYPMGMGIQGYNRLASIYMDDETRGGVENRSVHSLWFQGLSEVGPIGFFFFMAALISLYRITQKAKQKVLTEGNNAQYFKILSLECGLISYLVAGSFINQFRAEILYWMILLVAAAVNVYYLQHKEGGKQAVENNRKGIRTHVRKANLT